MVTERARSGGEKPGTESARGEDIALRPRPPEGLPRPSLPLGLNGEAGWSGPGPEPLENPQKPASRGRSGPVPPAAVTKPTAVFILGAH